MPEIWEHPFGYASLKVERAKKHITEINERLDSSPDRYGPNLHIDRETGEQFLYYRLTDRALSRDLALMVGDAVHNLHCALDIAWCWTYKAFVSNADPRFCKFPIYPLKTEDGFKATIGGKIPTTSPLFDLVVNGVKPYKGGNSDILSLHQLDIDDKHHLLIPMVTVTSLDGVELQHEGSGIEHWSMVLAGRLASYRKVVPLETKIKHHGEARFSIKFREGDFLQGEEVIPTLLRLSTKVNRILRIMQRMK